MYISRIEIENFRNFKHLQLDLHENTVIVGENKIGKSNLIHALRLVLDPKLPDNERQLRLDDFWDGAKPLSKDDCIKISVDIADFETDENLLATLAEHLIQAVPMVSRLTFLYRPKPNLTDPPQKEADYEFLVYGGDRPENQIGYELRKWMPLSVLPALRNAEEDLANWSRSPLAPLLRAVSADIDQETKRLAAEKITTATKEVAEIPEIKDLANKIHTGLKEKVGEQHAISTSLGFSPTDPDKLLRALRLFIDNGERGIGEASLGSANLLYLTLLVLELERQVQTGERNHTFLAIEEPEAHLHPHIQRLVFRDFLSTRNSDKDETSKKSKTVLLTTHSPHIVSVTPLKSIVVLKRSEDGKSTIGMSTANLDLDEKSIKDLERYLDAKRGEIVFSKGILLVEGSAEEFILPKLGKLMGVDFDELGISVCSVDGTNFASYVKFLHKKGLNLPVAVVTDLDPTKKTAGISRARALIKLIDETVQLNEVPDSSISKIAAEFGVFLNNSTLEIELFTAGNHEQMCEVLIELTDNGATKSRADALKKAPENLDAKQFLKDIEEIGKGRYAQRLASTLDKNNCPAYIVGAINYVKNQIH